MVILYSSHPEVIATWRVALRSELYEVCHYEKALFTHLDDLHVKTILVMEERHYGEDLVGFLELLRDEYPWVSTIVLSQKPTYAQGSTLLKYGIKAYGNTHMAPVHLSEALSVVQKGNVWLYPEFIQTMIQSFASQKSLHVNQNLLEKLSCKEKEIAMLIKEGLSNKEIALRESITERTVKAHLTSIYEKTGLKDRLALALVL